MELKEVKDKPVDVGMSLRKATIEEIAEMNKGKVLDKTVYPSTENTIAVHDADDEYGGAHDYTVKLSTGFNDGKATYVDSYARVSFVKKFPAAGDYPHDITRAGLQNEQLFIICIDRLEKMNKRFPDPRNEEMIFHLNKLLDLCKARVEDRMSRGVMGELKK